MKLQVHALQQSFYVHKIRLATVILCVYVYPDYITHNRMRLRRSTYSQQIKFIGLAMLMHK